MIIGRGMIANELKEIDQDGVIFFCSGVSNSNEQNNQEFEREKKMLLSLIPTNKKLIYFSSYFVNFENYCKKQYYRHKVEIEQMIQNLFEEFTIYRLPQAVGKSYNPNTLTNFIANTLINNEVLPIYKGAKRNLIDIEDVKKVVNCANKYHLFYNQIINLIAPKNYDIDEIVTVFESIFDVESRKQYFVSNEVEFEILLSNELKELYTKLQINFDEFYLENLINKYYKRS